MQIHLKRFTAVTFILFVVAFNAIAQENQIVGKASVQKSGLTNLEKILQRSSVPEIVEGALYSTIECKNLYPDLDYSQLLNMIDDVAKKNQDATISYKAYLTSMYLLHSSEIHVKPIPGAEDHSYLFKQIADQLENKLLASRSDDNAQ